MKVLSPVGNFDSLRAAVAGGADEVYLGINEFNARNNIDGFSMATLKSAVDFAHIFGVKVNLAINILFTDGELNSAVKIVVDAYNMGVDSFIIQDLGLAKILQDNYPEIEKHASTQMGLHNLEGVKAVEKYNFRRIVLARETPIDEVKRIKENTDVEIEYFAHGALCVSFSGNCYMSSYLHSASGNRGRCKQLCRLPYTLNKDGKKIKRGYLLSAKDFNMLNKLILLERAGVDVLKIEGRARRPYYVYATTVAYKNALLGKPVDEKSIFLAFNRGFTQGYFNGNSGIISKIQSHLGIKIGYVEKVNYGKNFNEIFIGTDERIGKKSTIKFIDKTGAEGAVVSAYDIKPITNGYILTTTSKISVGDAVHLIADGQLEQEISAITPRKTVGLDVYMEENLPMTATFSYAENTFTVQGEIAEKAKNRPLNEKEIQENFRKSELFDCKVNIKKLGDIFVAKSVLNEFRRKVFAEMERVITAVNRTPLVFKQLNVRNDYKFFDDFCIVESVEDIEKFNNKNVVYSPEVYDVLDVEQFVKVCERNDKKAYLDTPNFALEQDIEILKEIIEKTGVKIIANNYYALTLNSDYVVGGGLNVYNGVTASEYDKPIITAESELNQRTDFAYMTFRHCPIKEHVGGDCAHCKYQSGYEIKSDSGKTMKLKRKKLSSCTFYLLG